MRSAPPPLRMPAAAGALPRTDPLVAGAGVPETSDHEIQGGDGEGKGSGGTGTLEERNGARGRRPPGRRGCRLRILDTNAPITERSERAGMLIYPWAPSAHLRHLFSIDAQ